MKLEQLIDELNRVLMESGDIEVVDCFLDPLQSVEVQRDFGSGFQVVLEFGEERERKTEC